MYAHDWNVLKGERIRRWPSKIGDKRGINVDISSWVGISIGAKHVNVEVAEEHNQWWSEEDNAWVDLSCDAERNGYSLKASVYTNKEAIKVAKFFIRLIVGEHKENYEIRWDGPGKPKRKRSKNDP